MSGVQALVRLPLDQHRADRRRGLDTATLISGYRGSPLGGLDQTVERHRDLLTEHQVVFISGRQRGPRRHRGAGEPAGSPLRRRALRRRDRDVVRQGAGRRPERRHPAARELRGRRTERRRAGAGRRRSAGQVLDAADRTPRSPSTTSRCRSSSPAASRTSSTSGASASSCRAIPGSGWPSRS